MSNNSNNSNVGRLWFVFDIVIILLLGLVFSWFYLGAHAWGAWGDDSPGYIYTAAQLLHTQPLVSQSQLVQGALQYFGNEPWARLAAPTHHDIISPSGWVASRYPIGLSVLLYLVAAASLTSSAMYIVVPALAVATVIFTYLLAVLLVPSADYAKRVIGLLAAGTLGVTELFSSYAVSQPMRDIPALAFFLASFILLIVGCTKIHGQYWKLAVLLCAGVFFGYSINIRETSAILLLPLVIALLHYTKKNKNRWQVMLIFCVGMVLAGGVWLWNSAAITVHKEKFRAKDITSIAISSNVDHIRSLSFTNLYNNQGKYKRGVGGVNQYVSVLREEFNFWPPFLLCSVLGVIALWQRQRQLAYVLISWFGSIFLLFSMWINPYARYILPLFPVVTVLAGYGGVVSLQWLQQRLRLGRTSFGIMVILVVGSVFVGLQPLVAARIQHVFKQELVNKAITYQDLENFTNIGKSIAADELNTTGKPPVVLVIGFWQSGAAEMIMANSSQVTAIRYPRKRQEQPPVDIMVGWLQQLSNQYQLYLWYDDSATAKEQELKQHFTLEPVTQTNFSFQPNVQIYAITEITQ